LRVARACEVARRGMPKMRVGLGIDQVGICPHFVARSSNASFEYVAHAQLAGDLLGVDYPDRARHHSEAAASA